MVLKQRISKVANIETAGQWVINSHTMAASPCLTPAGYDASRVPIAEDLKGGFKERTFLAHS